MEGKKYRQSQSAKRLKLKLEKLKTENLELKNYIENQKNEIIKAQRRILQLKMQNDKKVEYISQFSHEFKTPLAAIMGFTTLLLESDLLREKQINYYKNILKASDHLYQIINYSIDMARAETNKINLVCDSFCSLDIINEVIGVLNEKIKEKNIKIKLDLKNIVLQTDKRRFRQIIYNLISNAYKYNKFGGEISIKTYCEDNNFYFEIKDSGCGIDTKKQKEVFEFFSNINTLVYDSSESSGIGLSLCRKIINMLGGKISFTSKTNEGSVFWFSLPSKNL